MTDVVLIHGDGIGPAVVDAAKRVLDAADADIDFSAAVMGQDAIEEHGTPLPDETVEAVREAGVALKGPVTTPIGSGFRSVNVALRRRLDCYANIRPARYLLGVATRITDPGQVDVVVVRENLEDLYAGIEFAPGEDGHQRFRNLLKEHGHGTTKDTAFSVKPISRRGSERVIRRAFEYAEEHAREKVTVVDKANIMKATDGLFMEVGEEVADDYAVDYEHVLVDNMAQQLVLQPEAYDVIVTQNIYGDILSDLTGGLVGGIGLMPSGNMGEETAVFESVHGTAPDIAGEGVADPTALVRAGAMLLRHVNEQDAARRVEQAVETVVADGRHLTPDLGGDASTDEMTDAIIEAI